MKKRILYMDVAKALAIFLVVWGHVIVFNGNESYGDSIAQYIYSFHTAFFMFLSGFFFSYSLKKDLKTLVVEKSRQLLLPYFSWSVVFLLLIVISSSGCDQAVNELQNFITGGLFRNFWYLKCLFIYIVITYVFVKVLKNELWGCIISFVLITLLPNLSFSSIFIPFFIAGHLTKPLVEKFDKWMMIAGLVVVDIILYALWNPSYNYISQNMSPIPYLIRTGVGCTTSLLIILLLKKVCTLYEGRITAVVAYLGTITLGIYVSHELFYSNFLWGWLFSYLPMNHLVYFVWAIIATLLSASIITLLMKNKWSSFIFLGKKLFK